MKDLEANVSFIPNLSAAQCAAPLGSFYSSRLEKISGNVFVSTSTGRLYVLIDEDATKEEVQDMVKWVEMEPKKNSS